MEKNLSRVPVLEELASVAGFSAFHFHRIFHAYTGENVATHIKRLRLERAASHLCHSRRTILDIALDAGFESESAFSKAFKKRFSKSPGVFRRSGIVESNTRNGVEKIMQTKTIEPKEIGTFEPLSVYFVRKTGPYAEAAEKAFSALMPFLYGNRLMTKASRCFGISWDDPNVTDPDKLRYEAVSTIEIEHPVSGEVERKVIEGGRYAVFLHKGPYEKFSDTYDAIFSDWLPRSGERLRDISPFEEYLNRDPRRTKPENLKSLIYIPLE